MIARNAKGFIYLVSVTGVTGERKSISEGLGEMISRVREHTSVACVCGVWHRHPGTSQRGWQNGGWSDCGNCVCKSNWRKSAAY